MHLPINFWQIWSKMNKSLNKTATPNASNKLYSVMSIVLILSLTTSTQALIWYLSSTLNQCFGTESVSFWVYIQTQCSKKIG